jgi:hypothetical protein
LSSIDINDINELQNTTSDDADIVEEYFDTNNLSINPTKTYYIYSRKINAGRKVD